MSKIDLLVVVDGIFSFAENDPSDTFFTITTFLSTLENSQSPTISVDTAHRRTDPLPSNVKFQNFNFATSIPDLSVYDEIWMFGYEGTNNNPENPGPPPGNLAFISDDEIAAIARFMNGGGGIFAAGDHEGLGSLMGGKIPRIRSMRKWFSVIDNDPTIPESAPRNWPPTGSTRADTLQPFDDGTYNFDNQSDDIPQKLTFPGGTVHPILQGPNGPITLFPDHMHEGEVITPWSLTDTLTFSGQTFIEYPVGCPSVYHPNGYQEVPTIIAQGWVIPGHPTPLEGSSCEQLNFTNDPVWTTGKTVNILCVYDGQNACTTPQYSSPGVGRVVTDSSFHHYIDLNLIGDPCGVGAKQQGFRTPAGAEVLADLQAFYINTVVWLANLKWIELSIKPTEVTGGLQNATGTVSVNAIVPAGGLQFNLTSAAPGVASVPGEIAVSPGSPSASFTIETGGTFDVADVYINAELANLPPPGLAPGAGAFLKLLPQPGPPGSLRYLTFNPSQIQFGDETLGTVTIVPSEQLVTVALTCGRPDLATVPPSVTIPAGHTAVSFTVETTNTIRGKVGVAVGVLASVAGMSVQGQLFLSRQSQQIRRIDLKGKPI
jgi:hypothetical protein